MWNQTLHLQGLLFSRVYQIFGLDMTHSDFPPMITGTTSADEDVEICGVGPQERADC